MERAQRHLHRPLAATVAILLLLLVLGSPPATDANVFTSQTYQRAQQVCVSFLGINEFRLAQYNKFVYPPDQDTMCLIRCVGITLGFWDDTEGFNVTFVAQEFGPLLDDQFQQTLTDGIANKLELIDPLDGCSRAYYAFRTFRNLLRQRLNPSTAPSGTTPPPTTPSQVPFRPLTALQVLASIADCARELHVPTVYMANLTQGNVVDVPQVRCLIQCAAKRTGVYSDGQGALLENLHRQLNPPGETLRSFVLRQKMCLQRNEQPASADACSRAFYQFFTCLRPDYERFFISSLDATLQTALLQMAVTDNGGGSAGGNPSDPLGVLSPGEPCAQQRRQNYLLANSFR